jgi:hypothetical protein
VEVGFGQELLNESNSYMAEILDFVPYKTHMSLKIRTEAHARKMKMISVGTTFMGNPHEP